MRELDPLVSEYQHDKRLPREAQALTTLRKVASLVKPIMRQRCWRVGALCEFYPQERNLLGLNINQGQKICLRLRYPSDKNQFIPIEQVVDTMLHELCHIVHGPHNQKFHALWNQLRDEHEELVRKGYTGEGFLSNGKRLGGQRIPLEEARRRARAAAEKRQSLNAGSGQKLGGAPVLRGKNIRQVIADAAQRRIEVTRGCASGTDEGRKIAEGVSHNGFKTKAEEDDANDRAITQAYIDLIQEEEREKYGNSYIPPSQENPAGPRSSLSPPPMPEEPKPASNTPPAEKKPEQPTVNLTIDDNSPDNWSCPICTLSNPPNFLCCDACASEKPQQAKIIPPKPKTIPAKRPARSSFGSSTRPPVSATLKPQKSAIRSIMAIENKKPPEKAADKPLGWLCHQCDTFMETEWWTCTRCGTMKLSG